MAPLPPAAPQFGDDLAIRPSPETLAFLARRRSASALTLGEPGPTEAELRALLTLATRAPDHGKLTPWRFIVLQGAEKRAFVEGLEAIAAARPDAAKVQAKLGKIRVPPLTVAVISRVVEGEIPEWEQRLSAGAVCAIMIIAVQAMGYGANWITDWYAYDPAATDLLGLTGSERVAGFVHLGTPTEPPLERVRPDVDALVTRWTRAMAAVQRPR
ncbi:MAG: nitroreductase [Caulobacteraceae bacterium]|nr:nitroreductase [Caulobacteraceae bacterium]